MNSIMPVESQGSCQSCWAHASTAAVAFALHKAGRLPTGGLETAAMISCAFNGGCMQNSYCGNNAFCGVSSTHTLAFEWLEISANQVAGDTREGESAGRIPRKGEWVAANGFSVAYGDTYSRYAGSFACPSPPPSTNGFRISTLKCIASPCGHPSEYHNVDASNQPICTTQWVATLRAMLMDEPAAAAVNSQCVTDSVGAMFDACQYQGKKGNLQDCAHGVVMGNNRVSGYAQKGDTIQQNDFSGVSGTFVDHNVLIVGAGEGYSPELEQYNVGYWIIRNSYGTGWGDGGYIKLARTNEQASAVGGRGSKQNNCGLQMYEVCAPTAIPK